MRIRINFGSDFCGETSCNICFKDAAEATKYQIERAEQLDKERQAYNQANQYREIARFNSPRVDKKALKKAKLEQLSAAVEKALEAKRPQTLEQIKCPRCSGSMVIRKNSYTGANFLGCKAFPGCRGTRPFPANLKQDEPYEKAKAAWINKYTEQAEGRLERKPIDIETKPITPITEIVEVKRGVVTVLQKEEPKKALYNPFAKKPLEVIADKPLDSVVHAIDPEPLPLPEVTFESLMSRSANISPDEQIKTKRDNFVETLMNIKPELVARKPDESTKGRN